MFNQYARRLGVATALLLSVGFGAATANASAVSATAELWDVTTSGGLTLSNNYYTQGAQSNLSGDTFNFGTTAQDIMLNAGNGFGTSVANSTYSDFSLPHTDAGVTDSGWASSMFLWSFDYTAGAAGVTTIDFDYNYNATIFNLAAGDTAGVSSYLSASVDGNPASEKSAYHFFVNQDGQADGEGHLVLTFNVAAGQTGSISFTAASQGYVTPVPVPAAVWLFGSALAGMVGLRRRKA